MQLVGFRKNDITNTLAFRFTDGVETTPLNMKLLSVENGAWYAVS